MRNLIDENPFETLHGRTKYCTKFINNEDIKGKKILNIGCGWGWFELNAIRHRCKKVIGIEPEKNTLSVAKKHISNDKIEFRLGSALKLPFKENYFDTIVAWDVIEHIPKHKEIRMFEEVYRVLKKGGIFYLSTPNSNLISELFDPAWWLIGHRHYNRHQIKKYAKSTKFEIQKTVIKGGIIEVISIINLYISKWIFKRKLFFKKFFNQKLDKEYDSKGFTTLFVKMVKKK